MHFVIQAIVGHIYIMGNLFKKIFKKQDSTSIVVEKIEKGLTRNIKSLSLLKRKIKQNEDIIEMLAKDKDCEEDLKIYEARAKRFKQSENAIETANNILEDHLLFINTKSLFDETVNVVNSATECFNENGGIVTLVDTTEEKLSNLRTEYDELLGFFERETCEKVEKIDKFPEVPLKGNECVLPTTTTRITEVKCDKLKIKKSNQSSA